jgi:hypothetical protein
VLRGSAKLHGCRSDEAAFEPTSPAALRWSPSEMQVVPLRASRMSTDQPVYVNENLVSRITHVKPCQIWDPLRSLKCFGEAVAPGSRAQTRSLEASPPQMSFDPRPWT